MKLSTVRQGKSYLSLKAEIDGGQLVSWSYDRSLCVDVVDNLAKVLVEFCDHHDRAFATAALAKHGLTLEPLQTMEFIDEES